MSVAGAHHQLMSSCLPSRLSRVRSPSPAPPRIRRYNACKAKAAEGRPPAFEAGRRGWLIARAPDSCSGSRGFESDPALLATDRTTSPSTPQLLCSWAMASCGWWRP